MIYAIFTWLLIFAALAVLATIVTTPRLKREVLFYKIRNWRAHWRAFYLGSYVAFEGVVARALGDADKVRAYGKCHAKLIRANGDVLDLGCVGSRVVTTAGGNYMRDNFNASAGGAAIVNFKYHATGTGSVAENITDTALGTEVTDNARATGSQAGATSLTYVTVGTIAYTASHAITEHGVFSAVTAGTLWDRTVFAAVNVASGDSLQTTYTLSITVGG